ncbi:MAG: hypothetical protein ACRDKK_01580 [Gaiellaceae bacterium]
MAPLGRILVSTTLVLTVVALAVGTASAKNPHGPPPAPTTLQGENLVAPFSGLTVTSNCDQVGTSTVGYHAEGAATGPYPGTFVADGTITIGPQTTPARPPTIDSEGTFIGSILTLTETFTITSGTTTITGTKQLTAPVTGEQERATCQNLTFFAGVTGTGRIVEVEAATTYQATINEPTGTSTDSGRATPVLTLVEITGSCPAGPFCSSNSGNFDQLFTLSDQVAAPCDEDDQGDDECEDEDD